MHPFHTHLNTDANNVTPTAVKLHQVSGILELTYEDGLRFDLSAEYFSDGHNSGIFTWTFLYELGSQQAQKWARYIEQLATAGKSREPRFIAVS
jgi:DUF971 family protein